MSLADALERAASALPGEADAIRPANGDPVQLLSGLEREAASRVLAWLLRSEPEAGGELAIRWAEEPAGAPPIQQLAEHEAELPKAGRKALRRALHVLRSRGIAVGEPRPAAPVVARLPAVGDRLELACVSAADPRGGRLAFLVEADPAGGARLFQVLLDEVRGVVDLELFSGGRSRIRRFLRELARGQSLPVAEAPIEAVRALIARTAAEQPAARPLPRGFAEWRSRVAAAEAGSPTPGDLAAEALGEDPSPERLRRAAELVAAGELGPWPPENARLEPVVSRLRELAEGRVIVSGARRQEQIDSAVGELAAELYAGDFGERTARRLHENAYPYWKLGREEDARACLAAAASLRGADAEESPVARALFESLFAPLLQRLRQGEEAGAAGSEEPSLLVKP